MKTILKSLAVAGLMAPFVAKAQMPNDAIYMGKKQLCVAGMYGYSSWSQYWENTLKRENFNIGTHTTQSVMVMPAYGISNRVNVILSLPYVWTSTSAGNLMGQHGIQDLAAWLKFKVVKAGGFSLNAIVGGSVPIGNYVPSFLPMSIGLQCRTFTGRLLASYREPKTGVYLTAHGSYGWRSNITIDQNSYQADDRVYNTDQVRVPNTYDAAVRLGVQRKGWQTEVWAERSSCLSGDNIRRNDMPFPTNNMQATTVGWYGKVQPRNIGVNARVGYVLDGMNVGQSTSYMVGLLYQINFNK
ncbi:MULTISPECIES: hypothetical protein [unclassified Spirosoma]|uniref:hypothetical protein n=1 Tax=unclassified Spirosoma TaxID=2621999 RepID=UPI0009643FA2|nr:MULTISPECIES: hypothetical protein [unclassified Spirosoma]MBN8821717.1 hypothetical protein [Spirosoma sp.]OJW80787.1 MAG: hypothetical protein BGO59_35605 [Spirosoma sp. 48-14]